MPGELYTSTLSEPFQANEKTTKKGDQTYFYWMASWREGGKVRNVHLGSCRKVDYETALQKAWKLKAKALGMSAN